MTKKILLLAAIASLSALQLQAQNPTPNAGFENWTQVGNHYDPNSWNTLNPSTSIIGVFTCTRATGADVHNGTYAIKLTTKSVFGITANGIASTATLITTPPYGVTGGIPYALRPDSITGWYKYDPASAADSGFVQFILQGSANDTIGIIRFSTPNSTVATYTRFSAAINYLSPNTPANSYWILSSSDGVNPVVNSVLIVDDLALVFNSTGLPEQETVGIDILNSLVTDEIFITNNTNERASFRLYNSAGVKVHDTEIVPGSSAIDASRYSSGIYFYQVTDLNSSQQAVGKLYKY
jgi:hypothetical protein